MMNSEISDTFKNTVILDTSFIIFLTKFRLDFISLIKSEFPNYQIFLTIESIEEIVNLYVNKRLTLPKIMFIFSIITKRNPCIIISRKSISELNSITIPHFSIKSKKLTEFAESVLFNEIYSGAIGSYPNSNYLLTPKDLKKFIEKIKEYSSGKNHYLDYNDLRIIYYFRKQKQLLADSFDIKNAITYMGYNRIFFVATGDIKLKKLLKREGISLMMFNPKKKRIVSL